jgi:hypothetical protein
VIIGPEKAKRQGKVTKARKLTKAEQDLEATIKRTDEADTAAAKKGRPKKVA